MSCCKPFVSGHQNCALNSQLWKNIVTSLELPDFHLLALVCADAFIYFTQAHHKDERKDDCGLRILIKIEATIHVTRTKRPLLVEKLFL
jgi:hypothetical protein